MVEVDVELRGTRRTSRRMRWWRRTKRHGSRRDTGGAKGRGSGGRWREGSTRMKMDEEEEEKEEEEEEDEEEEDEEEEGG